MAGKLKPCKPHQARSRATNRCRNKNKTKTNRKNKIKASSKRRSRSRRRSRSILPEIVTQIQPEQYEPNGSVSSLILQEIEDLRSEYFVPDRTEDSSNNLNKDMMDILYGVYRAASKHNMDLRGNLNFLDKSKCADTNNPYNEEDNLSSMKCGLSHVEPVDFSFGEDTDESYLNLLQKVIRWRTHVNPKNVFQSSDLKWAIRMSLTQNEEIDMCFLGEKGFIRLRLGNIVGAPGDAEHLDTTGMETEVDEIFNNSFNILHSVNQYLKEYGYVEYVEYSQKELKARKLQPIHWEYAVFMTSAISIYDFYIFENKNIQKHTEKLIEDGGLRQRLQDIIDSIPPGCSPGWPLKPPKPPQGLIGPPPLIRVIPSGPTILLDHPSTGYTGVQLLIGQTPDATEINERAKEFVEEILERLQKNVELFQKLQKKHREEKLKERQEWFKKVHQIFLDKEFIKTQEYLAENPLMIRGYTMYEKWAIYLKYILEMATALPEVVDLTIIDHPVMVSPGEFDSGYKKAKEVATEIAEKYGHLPGTFAGGIHTFGGQFTETASVLAGQAGQIGQFIATESVTAASDLFTSVIIAISKLIPDDPKPLDDLPYVPIGTLSDELQKAVRTAMTTSLKNFTSDTTSRITNVHKTNRLRKFFNDSFIAMTDGLPEKKKLLKLLENYNTKQVFNSDTAQHRFLKKRDVWQKRAFEEMIIMVADVIAQTGTPEEIRSLLEKGGMKYLQELSDEEAKDIAQRVADHEKTVREEIAQYNEYVEEREKAGENVVKMKPSVSQIRNAPHIGFQGHIDRSRIAENNLHVANNGGNFAPPRQVIN